MGGPRGFPGQLPAGSIAIQPRTLSTHPAKNSFEYVMRRLEFIPPTDLMYRLDVITRLCDWLDRPELYLTYIQALTEKMQRAILTTTHFTSKATKYFRRLATIQGVLLLNGISDASEDIARKISEFVAIPPYTNKQTQLRLDLVYVLNVLREKYASWYGEQAPEIAFIQGISVTPIEAVLNEMVAEEIKERHLKLEAKAAQAANRLFAFNRFLENNNFDKAKFFNLKSKITINTLNEEGESALELAYQSKDALVNKSLGLDTWEVYLKNCLLRCRVRSATKIKISPEVA